MTRWKDDGIVLQSFSGNSHDIMQVIELNSDTLVTASIMNELQMWRVSTGECLRTLNHEHPTGLMRLTKLSRSKFVSWGRDCRMRVWNDEGRCIETIPTLGALATMTRVDNHIVTVTFAQLGVAIRRIRYVLLLLYKKQCMTEDSPSLLFTIESRTKLLELCCVVISTNKELYNVEELKDVLPEDLFSICFGS